MDQHYLTPLFEPQSILLFTGPQSAPEQQTPQARALLAHMAQQPFKGRVTPLDIHTTGTLADLAQARADLAIIALPEDEIVPALELAGRIKVKAALVLSAGIGAAKAQEMHRVAQRQVLRHADAQRFFHIHILARPYRRHGDGDVPMVRRGDDHGVNLCIGEQFVKIRIDARAAIGPAGFVRVKRIDVLRPVGSSGFKAVAHRDGLGAIDLKKIVEQTAALAADSDMAETDAVVDGNRPPLGGPQRQQRAQRPCGAQKTASGTVTYGHGGLPV